MSPVAILGFAVVGGPASRADTPLTTERVVTGLTYPVFVTAPPGDSTRLFIVEQTGAIKIFKNGAVLPQPFITIDVQCCGDSGLLGFAFDPDYATNGYFYVNGMRVIDSTLTSVLERYTVSGGDPDLGNPNSGLTLLTLVRPTASHDNNMIAFGPDDGMLYTSFGDGGNQQDPFNRAQDGSLLFGKVLRLDVSNSAPGNLYDIPPDNPFVSDPMVLDEIWALGLRNPWRFSFDRLTSDMYLADVGQGAREEIDFEPGNSPGGLNHGWRCMEGSVCSGLGGCTCFSPSLTPPLYDYDHTVGCSVTGGYVYRGCQIPDLRGTYFFGDYCSSRIWSFRQVGGAVTEFEERTAELDPPVSFIVNLVSFGEDADGELYIVTRGTGNSDGEVFKIVPAAIALGDMNGNGTFDGRDVSAFTLALVNPASYAAQFPTVDPDQQGDFNCDGVLNINDRTGFVNSLLSN